jgi:hypothetical protein
MRSISGILKFALFLAVIVGIGIGIGWLATRPPQSSEPVPAAGTDDNTFKAAAAPAPGPTQPVGANGSSSAGTSDSGMTVVNWQDQIGDILASDSEISNKCANLLNLFPHLPEAGQIEAAHHLSNLVDDSDYTSLGKILTDPTTSTNVDDVLMLDVMNRPNALKLPTLLQIASDPGHPEAADARSKLAMYLEDDYGTDWYLWQNKINEYMSNNPD